MNRIKIISFILIFSVVLSAFFLTYERNDRAVNSQLNEKALVIIDAGHGGIDGGTQTSDGVLEKDINLSIAKKVAILCELHSVDYIMTRTDENSLADESADSIRQKKISDTKNRLKIIEDNPQALFLSIHQNYFTQSKYKGAQVFYSPNNPLSLDFAETMQNQIVELLQPQNNRIAKKTGTDIYLLYHAESVAIMVECGFLSNLQEAELLKTDDYQNKIAFAIFCGILKYLEA